MIRTGTFLPADPPQTPPGRSRSCPSFIWSSVVYIYIYILYIYAYMYIYTRIYTHIYTVYSHIHIYIWSRGRKLDSPFASRCGCYPASPTVGCTRPTLPSRLLSEIGCRAGSLSRLVNSFFSWLRVWLVWLL